MFILGGGVQGGINSKNLSGALQGGFTNALVKEFDDYTVRRTEELMTEDGANTPENAK